MSGLHSDASGQTYWEIDNGWDVFDVNGEKVGDVAEVQPHYLTVSKGMLFTSERYIPVWTIRSVEQDRVYLGVAKRDLESRDWERVPDDTRLSETTRTSSRTVDTGMTTGTTGATEVA